jgi:hypothetical protein
MKAKNEKIWKLSNLLPRTLPKEFIDGETWNLIGSIKLINFKNGGSR